MTRLAAVLLAATLAGCTTPLGVVGALLPAADRMGTKLLRPGVVGRSCAAQVFGVPTADADAALEKALAQILALDAEGDVVTNAEVSSWAFLTGVYNRRCIQVRGDLARTVRVITLPASPGHLGHH
jgi:hypothetical protein